MSNLQSIIKSFHLQDELNPKVWYLPNEKYMGDPDGQVYKMRPKVRERLLEIANIFIEFLDVNVVISDITMTGSLANYNWSQYSDVDLHILIDFDELTPLYIFAIGFVVLSLGVTYYLVNKNIKANHQEI